MILQGKHFGTAGRNKGGEGQRGEGMVLCYRTTCLQEKHDTLVQFRVRRRPFILLP